MAEIAEIPRKPGVLHRFLWQAVDIVLPPRCIVTGDIVEGQGMISPAAWAGLDFISHPHCVRCGYPFEFQIEAGAQCASCLADPPPFETARAALSYGGTGRELILKFKHGDQLHAVSSFVPWLRRAGVEMIAKSDVMVPVPLHYWRLVRRRYNQAALLARALAKDSGMPCIVDGLLRTRATPTQGHLGFKDRRKNVKNAFTANPKHDFKDKTIVLIDDVYTTGSTVGECAKALLKAGAAQVHVLTLARVVKPENL